MSGDSLRELRCQNATLHTFADCTHRKVERLFSSVIYLIPLPSNVRYSLLPPPLIPVSILSSILAYLTLTLT